MTAILEALHYFTLHNISWRALPAEFRNWNAIWKRFSRLSRAGVFEAFLDALPRPAARLTWCRSWLQYRSRSCLGRNSQRGQDS